ncbi:hypothetical protein MGG_17774 [Pyricularia oryzae 70-15]|uniref:Uncharacterized protein n=1 Tax=Pyricularia oryzae (strain 70-15 / ATCC MYA-4617 / FGSC 8958) TaxID=242507 RepID=G4NHS8_PYRO7|nr:uncharacterized protein MGG_17774 [Pyricularia oryzae 70-15]EHA47788.1 hypothetical protein MGG_17774 [Pyricularia oryzae 70-15]
MAEVFGIAAGAIGILPLGAQFVKGVQRLCTRYARPLHVLGDVENVEKRPQGSSNHPLILPRCQADYTKVLTGLEALQQRFPVEQSSEPGKPTKMRLVSEGPRGQLSEVSAILGSGFLGDDGYN